MENVGNEFSMFDEILKGKFPVEDESKKESREDEEKYILGSNRTASEAAGGLNAIVFAGGGSKGAYQIGAWKALNELGEVFQIATGTSIGSINAAFYVQKDYEAAEKMWGEVTAGHIMKDGINLDVSFDGIFSQKEHLFPFLKNYLNTKSVDNTPFHDMVKRYFSAEKFFSSDVDYALMTVNFEGYTHSDIKPVEMKKTDMLPYGKAAWQWIAASCACFPVFPVMEIEGKNYIDGGYYDNIPVASAIKLGATRIVVVDLNTDNNHEGYINHPRVTYIKPSKDLGAFLNFSRDVLDRSIKLGYNDTMKAYGKYYGYDFTFIPGEEGEQRLDYAAGIFTDILTRAEAEFDFSGKVRYQRINKFDGCTTVISDFIGKKKPTEREIFIGAAEMFMKAINFDEEKDYVLSDLLYYLKTEADRFYPLLEFDTVSAFAKVREFMKEFGKNKNNEIKKLDEDVVMLIFTSFMRTLQRLKL